MPIMPVEPYNGYLPAEGLLFPEAIFGAISESGIWEYSFSPWKHVRVIALIRKPLSLIKALRHHLFSTLEPVKEVSFADVLSYEQPTKYIVSNTEYSDNEDFTPVLTANKAFILGYTEEVEGIYDKGPCIILDDFTLDSKIVYYPFKVKSSAIKILSAKSTVSLRYIFEYLKFLDLNTEEHKRHYIAEIEPMTIELPDEDTIQSIACLFDRMDQSRKALERDLQLLKSQKNYLLSTLFI